MGIVSIPSWRDDHSSSNGRALAQITNALLKLTNWNQTKIWKFYQAAITEWQGKSLCPNLQQTLTCVENFSAAFGNKKKALLWASGFTGYCEDMIIIVCLPSLPRSPHYSRELSKPLGMSWKWSDFEGSKKEAESNALVCEKGTVIETSTSYMLTLSTINTVFFFVFFEFFFFLHTVTMDFHSNHWETAHTIIMPTWMLIALQSISFSILLHRKHTNLFSHIS